MMKTVTETKYQTSDGRQHMDEGKARTHELGLVAKKYMPKGDDGEAAKLTAIKLLEAMTNNPKVFAELLSSFYAPKDVAEGPKVAK